MRLTNEARVGIGPFSPQLRGKNAHFPERINLKLLNRTKPILTGLVSARVAIGPGPGSDAKSFSGEIGFKEIVRLSSLQWKGIPSRCVLARVGGLPK